MASYGALADFLRTGPPQRTKKMFSVAVWWMLENPTVYDNFVKYTVDGEERLKTLVRDLKRAIKEPNLRAMKASEELLAGRRPGDPIAWDVLDRLIGPQPRP